MNSSLNNRSNTKNSHNNKWDVVCIQLSAWVSGPGKTMLASARDGYISPKLKFWKKDKFGDSPSIMYVQAVVVSVFLL